MVDSPCLVEEEPFCSYIFESFYRLVKLSISYWVRCGIFVFHIGLFYLSCQIYVFLVVCRIPLLYFDICRVVVIVSISFPDIGDCVFFSLISFVRVCPFYSSFQRTSSLFPWFSLLFLCLQFQWFSDSLLLLPPLPDSFLLSFQPNRPTTVY